jgi:glutamate--cysteine ligase
LSSQLQQQLQALSSEEGHELLRNINRGLEKESLRIDSRGRLSQAPHPTTLGSALTHSSITTDYSEALLEFITPVSNSVEHSLEMLEDVHSFVYQKLDGEMLWSASMPCIVSGDEGIPVAQYGSSNVARMKTVYRYGLGHRYGRLMQAIAGIHYNFSLPEDYWQREWKAAGEPGTLTDYRSERYLDLIRNFRRYSWLLIYLFGASPAVCASFLRGRDNHGLQPFDENSLSLYRPYGTALRMGDLGYNSDAQHELDICYNCLDSYVETLRKSIMQPHPNYADIPSGQNGDYQQLNDSLLQIENEFYSPIRPKRVAYSGETPLTALRRGGVEYIEVRCVDVSPFNPVGLTAEQIRFMDSFLMYCLLADSPPCDTADQQRQAHNLDAIVNRGREPGLELQTPQGSRPMTDIANELLDDMESVARQLDEAHQCDLYQTSVDKQRAKIADPELTPSARILREMKERDMPFFPLAMEYSKQWAEYFRNRQLAEQIEQGLEQESLGSLQAQKDLEQADDVSFKEYLASFYAQYESV